MLETRPMTLAYDIEVLDSPAPRAPGRPWLLAAAAIGIAALAVRSPEVREIVVGLLTVGVVWVGALIALTAASPPEPQD